MRLLFTSIVLLGTLPLAACATDEGGGTPGTRFYVASSLDMGVPSESDPTRVPGFDLDGRVSEEGDAETCGHADHTSPFPEGGDGVDNELGPLIASVEESFGIREGLATVIRDGRLLTLLELRGVDDLVDDESVELVGLIGLLPEGVTAPELDGMGHLAAGQTFDVDASSFGGDGTTPQISLSGSIVGGRLHVGPGELSLSIPIGGELREFSAQHAEVAFDVTEDGLQRGVLGASIRVDDIIAQAEMVEGVDVELVRTIAEANSDLEYDGASDECQAISVGLVFDGVPAMRGETRAR